MGTRSTRRLGDRAKGIAEILKMLSQFNIADITALAQAVSVVATATDMTSKVTAALEAMTLATKLTPSPEDDRMVDMLQQFMSPDMIVLLVKAVESLLKPRPRGAEPTINVTPRELKAVNKAIPIGLLLQVGMQIAQLIIELRNKKKS